VPEVLTGYREPSPPARRRDLPGDSLLTTSFRPSLRDDIVHYVMLPATMRAKLAVAAFVVVALLYGSVCSTTCALGACPIETQNAAGHDCDHGASSNSHQRDPQNPDCAKHHHPTFDAVKADVLSQFQLNSASHAAARQLLAVAMQGEASSVSADALSPHLAPPPNLNIPLQQQVSVLRI